MKVRRRGEYGEERDTVGRTRTREGRNRESIENLERTERRVEKERLRGFRENGFTVYS